MVLLYESQAETGDSYTVIIGGDKYENDLLIKYGFPELNWLWFHVDQYPSAHVYLCLQEHQKWSGDLAALDIPHEVMEDCLQICKSGSSQAKKLPQCQIICTPRSNLRKNRFMKPGEVSFKTQRYVKRLQAYGRNEEALERLRKTRLEMKENVEKHLHEAYLKHDSRYISRCIKEYAETFAEQSRQQRSARKLQKKLRKEARDWGMDSSSD